MEAELTMPAAEQADTLARDKLDARHEIKAVLDRFARLQGLSREAVGAALDRYIDDMLDDLSAAR
jgi:hypothetical protein